MSHVNARLVGSLGRFLGSATGDLAAALSICVPRGTDNEPARAERKCRNCTRDEGRPLEVGLQEQASNHPKLLRSRAVVVGVEGKGAA